MNYEIGFANAENPFSSFLTGSITIIGTFNDKQFWNQ
jgi:hypothetical protein